MVEGPVEFGREENRRTPEDRVGTLEFGVLPLQPFQLRRLLRRNAWPLAAIDLSLTALLPNRLRRPDTQQRGHPRHRGPVGLMVRSDLADHPDRPLTQLDRVPFDVLPDMTPSFPRTGVSGLAGAVQVEVWFGIVERQAIRRGVFKSFKDLDTKIRTFIDGWNDRSHPFVWTKTAEQILAKANRSTTSNPRH